MVTKARAESAIRRAFVDVPYPGDAFLVGRFDGCEPEDSVAPFRGHTSWAAVEPALLDANADALSFFSEAGFRFFLPAFLLADLSDELERADPLFHLVHGFHDSSVTVEAGGERFEKHLGRSAFVNPRRYGAMRFEDYARYRLSIFAREEAGAILAYLENRAGIYVDRAEEIADAIRAFWRPRSEAAPTQAALARHLEDEQAYLSRLLAEDH